MLDSAPCSSRGRHSGIVRGTRWIKEMEKDSLEASEYVGDAATAMYFMVFLQVIHSISDPSLMRTSRSLSGREGDFPFRCHHCSNVFVSHVRLLPSATTTMKKMTTRKMSASKASTVCDSDSNYGHVKSAL